MLRFSKITAASMTAGAFALALLPTANASVMELGVSATSNSTNWLTNGLGQIGTTQEAVDWNVAGDITGFSFLTPPTTTTVNQSYLTGSPSNPSLQRMFQLKSVLRTAISGSKINAVCVLSAASFSWLHGRHGAGVLGAGSLPPVPATAAPMPAVAGCSCTAAFP